jgi:hypothetical protein
MGEKGKIMESTKLKLQVEIKDCRGKINRNKK